MSTTPSEGALRAAKKIQDRVNLVLAIMGLQRGNSDHKAEENARVDMARTIDKEVGFPGWHPISWKVNGCAKEDALRIDLVTASNGPDKYAVRSSGICLAKSGEWEVEPSPSHRDKEFFERCRFDTFEAAVETYRRSQQQP